MDANENSILHTSQLRQPSKIPASKALFEISDSENNARAPAMPPSESLALKHRPSALPEPAPKRKTLAERAGEISKAGLAAPSSARPINSAVKATTLAGVRNASLSSSVSSRTPSASSRNVSGSSFATSIGPGSRPPSIPEASRPQTSMGYGRSSVQAAAPAPASRPASSLDDITAGSERPKVGKRKGMPALSISTFQNSPALQRNRPMGSYDNRLNYISNWSSSCAARTCQTPPSIGSHRDFSIPSAMAGLTLDKRRPAIDRNETVKTPSKIPKLKPIPPPTDSSSIHLPQTPSKSLKLKRSKSPMKMPFMTPDSNLQAAWDTKGRLEDIEYLYTELKEKMSGTANERDVLEETVGLYRTRISELETIRTQLSASNTALQTDLETTRSRLSSTTSILDDERRDRKAEIDECNRQHRNEMDNVKREAQEELDKAIKMHRDQLDDLERRLTNELRDERSRRERELADVDAKTLLEKQKAAEEIDTKEREIRNVKSELQQALGDLERAKSMNNGLQDNLAESSTNILSLESSVRALRARIDFLESDSKAQSQSFADLEQQLQDALASAREANEKLRQEETLRRKLHNQVQELKGNIRVFCRVRPILNAEPADQAARIAFPDQDRDSREVEVLGPEEKSSLGNITTKTNAFAFDRIFGPNSQNADVFEEISQLVQSALDGYNVCIFCYGQTGSGKTFTMSADDGMIPRAVRQIYDTAQSLEDKGWKYTMEGSFVEVYNENLNDLLGKAEEFDKKKHEIRHDHQNHKTTITDINTVFLDSPAKVDSILRRATANRSVAATKANERSSRSHSVFILKLIGENLVTGEKSEGTLNLVDLAGSERLSHSGSTGERLRETQNINRSLSCLGDVIGALGQGKEGGHVPYRNSKLTYLLQFSLGGNSKTLMFVMISPLQAHLSETLTSLKFATK
ncbi:MAG: hypothetical protein M1819_001134, partial [Sarea resinae]